MSERAAQIELILRRVESLPTLSPVATRMLSIAGVEDADLDALVEVIESDPPLTARLLGLCRRADKGWGDRITTVRRAVVMLGLEAVQAAALSVAVYDVMNSSPGETVDDAPGVGAGSVLAFDRAGFWRYSVAVATASELVAEGHHDLGVPPAEAFVAGLLHGLGKLALEMILPRAYGRVLALAERRQAAAAQVEQEVIGLDHHTAGKRLGEHWGLPAPLRDAMWLYGHPLESLPELPHRNLIGIVSLARMLCLHLHLGFSGDFNHPEALDGERGMCKRLGVRVELVEAAVARIHEGVIHRSRVLGLGEQSEPELLLQSIGAANQRLGRMAAVLEHRARAAQRQTTVLGAVRKFHAALGAIRPAAGLSETLSEVSRSAAEVLGEGFYAAVVQTREDESWQLLVFDASGRPTRSQAIEPPAPHGAKASLATLCSPTAVSFGALASLPWLWDDLVEAPDMRKVQTLSLSTAQDPGQAAWPAAILLHDRDLSAWDRALLSVLTATWASAIAAASHHEGARRLGERLAASNRSLAETQAKLAETQSLARLGEMASGAAHEMNNPLTVISGRAQMLAAVISDAQERAAAQAIVAATRSLTDLITSLRMVADPPTPRPSEIPLDALVAYAVARARERAASPGSSSIPAAFNVKPQLRAPLPLVRVDRELAAGALAEVIVNGVQASNGAPVVVRAETGGADSRLLLVVEDRGTGLSAKALQHAFDPFFSDLPAGRRTGLGLTRARRAVELHGGEIALAPREGGGTVATISIPGAVVSVTGSVAVQAA